MSKIIAISNQKGGVGKSTTAINLSAAVAEKSYKVLVADLDPQGNTTSGFGIDKSADKKTIYDVLTGEASLDDAIVETKIKGLSVLPSGIDLAGIEIELANIKKREFYLKDILDKAQAYDYIFIDCPPSLGLLTINSLTAADSILVPIQCEFFALEGLTQLMNTVRLVKKHLNSRLEIEGVALTMYDSRTNLSAQVSEELRKYFGSKVYSTIIPRNVRLGEAPSYGLSILEYAPRSAGAEAYRKLAEEFLSKQ